jgi:hypothetical protein
MQALQRKKSKQADAYIDLMYTSTWAKYTGSKVHKHLGKITWTVRFGGIPHPGTS